MANQGIVRHLNDLKKRVPDRMVRKRLSQAVESISKYPLPIESGAKARDLNGVGEWIATRIDEYLRSELHTGAAPSATSLIKAHAVLSQTVEPLSQRSAWG
ncbi:hypothetical protein DIPPA_25352 [Diplonema papillatum]|nr:hypothetical protein DIPPA_25352 [Diplonema papillatum]